MTAAPEGSQSSSKPDDGGWVGVFIRRPILALVVNLLIIIAGVAALQSIEIRELPDVDRPVVTVRELSRGNTGKYGCSNHGDHRKCCVSGAGDYRHIVNVLVRLEPRFHRVLQ